MADRSRQAPVPPPRRAPPVTGGVGGVSRNLFQSRLTRRPTPVAGAGAGQASSSSHNGTVTVSEHSAPDIRMGTPGSGNGSESGDIVVRDRNGDIVIAELPMAGILDDGDEDVLNDEETSKQERQRLADAVKQHRVNHAAVPDQPEEVLDALRKSLRAKVVALEEDQWMYETGDQGMRR
ncbi:hypothetical protein F5X68DRAFT_276342 [Plectosphaerella plurivora]|uniref:Uncharacterized protein n=1 Tax=Plectosphaerella plurivora TaxID=936078 RepID=A0A9P8VBC4_9PEZI|nr:hypothetical protein F5X68DRAFT_276342 [Plectosphaerella plurivora]